MPRTLEDLDVSGKRVLLRSDLNVPMQNGVVTDSTRITRLAPTILELCHRGAVVIVISHFGRPRGVIDPACSLAPIASPLSSALGGKPVRFAGDCIGPGAQEAVLGAAPGDVVLLENLRFHRGEQDNDPAFASRLTELADFFVNDAFSVSHRAHASTDAIARLLPCAAGRLLQAELEALRSVLEHPEGPMGALVGGSKVSTKIGILEHLVSKVDMLFVGGAMANTFLCALGHGVGTSIFEPGQGALVTSLFERAESLSCEIVLPTDVVVADELVANCEVLAVPVGEVPGDQKILDVGPETTKSLARQLGELKTLVWNGPLGAFEVSPFDEGTVTIARAVAELTRRGQLKSVAGGGDTIAALGEYGQDLSYVSTAGGAFLEWLEGRSLPGVVALDS